MTLDHHCALGYTLQGSDTICGTQQLGSVGENNLGGPNWPTEDATPGSSETECSKQCNHRTNCTHYMWFADNGCRLQSSCIQTVAGYGHPRSSFICKKGNKIENVNIIILCV